MKSSKGSRNAVGGLISVLALLAGSQLGRVSGAVVLGVIMAVFLLVLPLAVSFRSRRGRSNEMRGEPDPDHG